MVVTLAAVFWCHATLPQKQLQGRLALWLFKGYFASFTCNITRGDVLLHRASRRIIASRYKVYTLGTIRTRNGLSKNHTWYKQYTLFLTESHKQPF